MPTRAPSLTLVLLCGHCFLPVRVWLVCRLWQSASPCPELGGSLTLKGASMGHRLVPPGSDSCSGFGQRVTWSPSPRSLASEAIVGQASRCEVLGEAQVWPELTGALTKLCLCFETPPLASPGHVGCPAHCLWAASSCPGCRAAISCLWSPRGKWVSAPRQCHPRPS